MKHSLKLICILLCVCLFFGIFSACAEEKEPQVPESDGYEKLAHAFSDSAPGAELLQTVDLLLEGIAKPTVQIYTDALVTAMVTYDKNNAPLIVEQYKKDNLHLASENNFDLQAIETATTTTMLAMDDSIAVFQEEIPTFFRNLSQIKDNPARWILAVSGMETVAQNYTVYHAFLQGIAENTTGALKIAAVNLQGGMEMVAKKTASIFAHDTETNFGNCKEFFFSEWFFTNYFPKSEDYITNSNFQVLVDIALTAITTIEEVTEISPQGEDAWKMAYIDFIVENDLAYIGSFKLVNIDNDAIPELYCSSNYIGGGDDLCSYYNGALISQHMYLDGLAYFEGENYFLDSGGIQDNYYGTIYTIENGSFVVLHQADYGFLDGRRDEEGYMIYDYYWDGEKIATEEEFYQLVYAAFDAKRATTLYNDAGAANPFCDFEEISKKIILYETNG